MILVPLVAAAAIAAGAATGQPAGGSQAAPGYTEITKTDAQTLIAKCGSRRFETYADVPADGKIKRSKLTLCAPDSDSHAAWISKLEKASTAIEANPQYPQRTKLKLLGDFREEIARLKAMPQPAAVSTVPQSAPQAQLPLAMPIAAAPPKPADVPAYVPPAGVTNRLTLVARCLAPGSGRSQPCEQMAPNERLEIRAESDIASPVTLLFRQTSRGLLGSSGKEAEVELASDGMRRGETVVLRVPKKVCSGFRAKFEVEVRTNEKQRPNQSPYILGPFEMRCPS